MSLGSTTGGGAGGGAGKVKSNEIMITATPAAIGKTGIQSCLVTVIVINETTTPFPPDPCSEIPGAANIRGMMFLQIAALGAAEVADDISDLTSKISFGDGSVVPTPTMIRNSLRDPSAVSNVFNGLDVNPHDGTVTFAEIFAPQNVGFDKLLPAVQRTLGLGAGHEDFAGFGAHLADLGAPNPAAVGSPVLCSADPSTPCSIFPEPPLN
jgi:hypothetical protein